MHKGLVLILLFFSFLSFSQETLKENLKVGLVLSGGGAKGFAHIGTLKVLDSLGVRVDYIAGTSMGGIVGALYASGYSGKELDSIFTGVDFEDIIGDNLPREAKTFYERDQSEKYAVTLPFNKFKLQLPSALSKGQNVFNLLTKITLHVNAIKDFSKLPIPFFCIATNIETGEAVILDKGNLAKAISASGAFPSLFQPVIIDDQILIDGGVVNNYPIDELKSKGMDFIIGADVQDTLLTREQLKSAPDILLQINNYRTINDMKEKSKITDIYIKPNITDYSVISFSEVKDIIEKGRLAAIKNSESLKQLASRQTSPINKTRIQSIDSIRFDNIDITGNNKYTFSYLMGKLKIKRNETMSYYDFNKGVNNLMATNNFDAFDYTIAYNDEGGYNLLANVKESEITTYLKFGAHYDDLYKSAILANLTKKSILFNNDIASLDVILGENARYNFEYFIDKGYYWSVGLRSRFNQFDKSIAANALLSDSQIQTFQVNRLDVELDDFTNQFFVQTRFQKDFSLTLGVEHKKLRIASETIINNNDNILFENSDFLSAFGQLRLDSFTDKHYPKRGFLVDTDFHLYFGSSDFNNNFSQFSLAKAHFAYAFGMTDKISATIGSQGGFKIGDDSTQSLNYALGGYGNNFINNYMPFFGYDFAELNGNSFVKAYVNLDYEIFKKNHFLVSANFANIDSGIFESGEWFTTPDFSGYAVGYGVETFLGPIEARWTFSGETKQSIWFFNLGFWF